MNFKKRVIEELNLKGNNYTDLYQEYFDVCEKLAKEYHNEQCNIADVVGQSEQLKCGFCSSDENVEEIPVCDKCWDGINNH